MRPTLVPILAAALFAIPGLETIAQSPPCPAGTSIANYRVDAIGRAYFSILGMPGTTNVFVSPNDDATTAAIPFPAGFVFSYYGVAKTSFKICTNGFINFSTSTSATATNRHPGDGLAPNDCIFPWHDDLVLSSPTASVDWRYDASADAITVQWTDMGLFGIPSVGGQSFQVILYGTTSGLADVFEFRYQQGLQAIPIPVCVTNPSTYHPSATVGCENAAADPACIGVDATERGGSNSSFPPPCDFQFTPVTEITGPVTMGTALAVQEPYCSIDGLPGTVQLPPPCVNPCYEDDNSAQLLGAPILFPWKVHLFGRTFKSCAMSANGVLVVGQGSGGTYFSNGVIPAPSDPEAVIAPFWDDLEGTANSRLLYRVDGLPGCRVMTFEWKEFGHFLTPGGNCVSGGVISFQAKLFEGAAGALAASNPPCPYDLVVPGIGNDRIEFHYDHAGFVPPPAAPLHTASIGAENHNGTAGAACIASATIAAPPTTGGAGAKCVLTPCDVGTIHYYGDASPAPFLPGMPVPEFKTNEVPMVSGNTVSLEMVGTTADDAYLMIQAFGALPGTNLPVPCGGLPFSAGSLGTIVFWVNIADPGTLILGPFPTDGGCVHLDFPLPLGLTGIVVYAQWGAVSLDKGGNVYLVELTEGAKIVIG